MKISRREMLKISAGTGAALLLREMPASAQDRSLLMRSIPSSGEQIPAVGLGNARSFSRASARVREVLRLFHETGGRFVDTAPTYGGSESETGVGRLVQELGIQDDLFFATKISTGEGWGTGIEQQEASLQNWGRTTIDLNQVHNLRDVDIHLRTIRQAKEQGRTRYVGVTATFERQYQELEQLIRTEKLDFVQLKYTLGERRAADRLLPLAQDRGVGVLVNEPFSAGRLFRATSGLGLPGWAADFDCRTWAQFLKYILAHPAVTVVIPSTVDPEHLVENMGAGVGRLPDESTRTRMEGLFDAFA